MDFIASFYPPLEARAPLPALFNPLLYALSIGAVLLPRQPAVRAALVLPAFAYLFLARPFYTVGGPASDYGSATVFFAIPLAFLDMAVLSPREGRAPRYFGRDGLVSASPSASPPVSTPAADAAAAAQGRSEANCATNWERIKWSLRLNTSARGVGWDWRVKNVPMHGSAGLPRWAFARAQLMRAVLGWAGKCAAVYGLAALAAVAEAEEGASATMAVTELAPLRRIASAWLCGVWGYHQLAQLYHLLAAITVAVGVCEPWEWPPLFGPLKEAWSVRQMWSVVWHQNLRRSVQQPGIRLSRALGFAKGTLTSKYFQLYVAFAISMLSHQWNIFNAVRRDVGEARFFMSQAAAITIEDFVQWLWQKASGRTDKDELLLIERVAGWTWTFAWFSYSLPAWTTGMYHAGIVGHEPDTAWALALGNEHAARFLRL